jgi:hypothetical protein
MAAIASFLKKVGGLLSSRRGPPRFSVPPPSLGDALLSETRRERAVVEEEGEAAPPPQRKSERGVSRYQLVFLMFSSGPSKEEIKQRFIESWETTQEIIIYDLGGNSNGLNRICVAIRNSGGLRGSSIGHYLISMFPECTRGNIEWHFYKSWDSALERMGELPRALHYIAA